MLYELVNETVEYDDETVCLAQGIYRKGLTEDEQAAQPKMSIKPNPASDNVEISFAKLMTDNAMLEIINNTGRLVKKVNLSKDQTSVLISVSSLLNGLYIIKLLTDDTLKEVTKLSVIK